MGRRGKRTQSAEVKHARGNPGKGKIIEGPRPTRGIPPMPRGLDARAKAAWRAWSERLNALGLMTHLDGLALEMVSVAYAKWRHAQVQVPLTGGDVITQPPSGRQAPNPWVDIRDREFRNLAMMLKEFGMTPNSRAGLKVEPPPERDPLDAFEATAVEKNT